jgi:diguanylate cyclase (GGDEF)-like protein
MHDVGGSRSGLMKNISGVVTNSVCLLLLSLGVSAWAAESVPLTSMREVKQLSNAEAAHHLPVKIEATVNYFRIYEGTLFVEDENQGIYVYAPIKDDLLPGDRILIEGKTDGSFRPIIRSTKITLLHHGQRTKPELPNYDDLIHSRMDCRLVTLRGRIRVADFASNGEPRSSYLSILFEGNEVGVVLNSEASDADKLKNMLDAEAEITGVVAGRFDGKMQSMGVLLHVAALADIKILKRATVNPWSLPLSQMDEIATGIRIKDDTLRTRVQGTVTYYLPGAALVLQNGSRSLWVNTSTRSPLLVGDVADVVGFPVVHDGFLMLDRGEVEDSHVQAPQAPLATSWSQLATSKNIFDLVLIEGQVVTEVREVAEDDYVVLSEGQLFTAILRHPDAIHIGTGPKTGMKEVAIGSQVRVTGICIPEDSNPFNNQVPFNILMRSGDDIAVIANPSWLNVRNLLTAVSLLLLAMFAVSCWVWMLNRKVRRQTADLAVRAEAESALERRMALLEQRRSRILEAINGKVPLAEIIEEIAEMTSFRLESAPCWCEIENGARLGYFPPDSNEMRVHRATILGRLGITLGVICVGLPASTNGSVGEDEALTDGAKLAALAIETRRLYSDLVHRSEFDLLTDAHNRFSFDQHLEFWIEEARKNASIVGLIYLDLDKFKQVNDVYGHHVGDLYLQEVSERMKHQLRANDLLARLGGDEFVALLPQVHHRKDVVEVAERLEECFIEPFDLDGNILHGSASIGIALYPEDGTTKSSLLSAADAKMYVAKNARREVEKALEDIE